MKRIGWTDLVRPGWNPFIRDLQDTFGAPQLWTGSVTTEPGHLGSPHQWALGRHYSGHHPEVCVWVTDEVYTWYMLRWAQLTEKPQAAILAL